MKRVRIVFSAIFVFCLASFSRSAFSTSFCLVKAGSCPSSSCTSYSGATANGPDWYVNCCGNIKGVSKCGYNPMNPTVGSTAPSFTANGNGGNNTVCYCKVIYPLVSKNWMVAKNFSTGAECEADCSSACVDAAKGGYLSILTRNLY